VLVGKFLLQMNMSETIIQGILIYMTEILHIVGPKADCINTIAHAALWATSFAMASFLPAAAAASLSRFAMLSIGGVALQYATRLAPDHKDILHHFKNLKFGGIFTEFCEYFRGIKISEVVGRIFDKDKDKVTSEKTPCISELG
jgi:hypothetical protein